MNQFSPEMRKRMVKQELTLLEQEGLISAEIYKEVIEAQEQYSIKIQKREQERAQPIAKTKKVALPIKKEEFKKKVLSPEKLRERNITWLLNLGVILLLVGGLVLATSAWDILADWGKTGLIALVSLLFFGLAFFTMRILKIKQTAFSFYVLGSLFLPIVVLSAGFFELFGPYLSFTGEGRYLYGAMGSILILPVFIILSIHLVSRLFVWFSYITVTCIMGFLIAALYLPVDGFYFGIMLFNGGLITLYLYVKDNKRFKLFTSEFLTFIQANLILSTLLMLVFYQSDIVHGVNLFLTAAIYFAMIFVTKRQEYHFVFTLMLVYAAYQLIEFTALIQIDGIAYALLGFVFLGVSMTIPGHTTLKKVFHYTSAFVSGAAFLYITVAGVLLRMDEPSIILFIAYLLIAVNFLFLANSVKQTLFKYLSPIFLIAASAELVLLIEAWFGLQSFATFFFIFAFVLYVGLGCYMKLAFFQIIKQSTRDIALAVMALSLFFGWLTISFWQVGVLFILFSSVGLFMDHFEKRSVYAVNSIGSWLHTISVGLAVLFFYRGFSGKVFVIYDDFPFKAEHFVIAAIVVLFVSYVWRYFKKQSFYNHGFYAAQFYYLVGILASLSLDTNDGLRSLIMLGGIAMGYLLYRKLKKPELAYAVSGMTLVFYLTVVYLIDVQFNMQSFLYFELQFLVGAVLLLGVGTLIGRKEIPLRNSFWWIGHVFLPVTLILNLFVFNNSLWSFLVATIIYGFSLRFVSKEWKIKLFLYAGFTTLFASVSMFLNKFNLSNELHYAFLITSFLIAALWFMSKTDGSKRVAYYLVPFSIIGISTFSLASPFSSILLTILVLYTVVLLFIMHQQKWAIYNIIPLIILLNAIVIFGFENVNTNEELMLLITGFVLVAFVAGMIIHQTLYYEIKDRTEVIIIDWYTGIAFIASFYLYLYTAEPLWTKLLPGILVTTGLLLQRRRVSHVSSKWFIFAACLYMLQPYYVLLQHVSIPGLIERELYILPWVILVVYLKRIIIKEYRMIINYLEWVVLLVIGLILVRDAMLSVAVYEALILGCLSLISLLAGMLYRRKTFFFVGTGVLLLNVFLQTRAYWGNLPWWAYLLIAGSILIGIASYNEWHKQKVSDGKETLVSRFKRQVVDKVKKWD